MRELSRCSCNGSCKKNCGCRKDPALPCTRLCGCQGNCWMYNICFFFCNWYLVHVIKTSHILISFIHDSTNVLDLNKFKLINVIKVEIKDQSNSLMSIVKNYIDLEFWTFWFSSCRICILLTVICVCAVWYFHIWSHCEKFY